MRIIALRTTTPPKLTIPMNAVKPKGLRVSSSPITAPGSANGMAAMTMSGSMAERN